MQFKEIQKFASWVMWLIRGISIPVLLFCLWGYYQQVIIGNPIGDKPGPDWLFSVMFVFQAGIWWLFEKMQLETIANSSGIQMSFFPFTKKKIRWADIEKAEVINYGFVGGWGVRIGTKYGTVYNTQGKEGLWLRLKDGSKFVIGTQKKNELQRVLDMYLP